MDAPTDTRPAHVLHDRHRTTDVLSSENINVDFESLLLSEPVQRGLTSAGFQTPSPIQLKAIPLGRCGLDLIVQAKSGTGKTCVFSVIALESVMTLSSSLQVLVLAPTREIAVQIQQVIQAIGSAMEDLRCYAFIGGTIFGQDKQKLKKCHIAVGTPGRIKQLIEYDVLKTDSVRLFILDEADKLLDEKFQAIVNWIYHQMPDNKQMLALSATYPEYLAQQLTNYMRDPTFVRLNPKDLALQGIKQFYRIVPGHRLPHEAFQIKVDHLLEILSQVAFNQCLIFSNFQSRAHNLCVVLVDKGWPAAYISGNHEQAERMKAMHQLKTFKCRILISTDLTSRGIDAENVNVIINLDVPNDFKTYLHRIGRAGRFGSHGAAITLASEGEETKLLQLVKKKSGSDIRMLPVPIPSNLLEMSANQLDVETFDYIDELCELSPAGSSLPVTKEMEETLNHDFSSFHDSEEQNRQHIHLNENICAIEKKEKRLLEKEEATHRTIIRDDITDRSSVNCSYNSERKETNQTQNDEEFRDESSCKNKSVNTLSHEQPRILRDPQNLEKWLIPDAVIKEARKIERKIWTWEEAVRAFEESIVEGDGIKYLNESKVDVSEGQVRLSEELTPDHESELVATGHTSAILSDKLCREELLKQSDIFVEFTSMKRHLENIATTSREAENDMFNLKVAEGMSEEGLVENPFGIETSERSVAGFNKNTEQDKSHSESKTCDIVRTNCLTNVYEREMSTESLSEELRPTTNMTNLPATPCTIKAINDPLVMKSGINAAMNKEGIQIFKCGAPLKNPKNVRSSKKSIECLGPLEDLSEVALNSRKVYNENAGASLVSNDHMAQGKHASDKKLAVRKDNVFYTNGPDMETPSVSKNVGNELQTSDNVWEYFKRCLKDSAPRNCSITKCTSQAQKEKYVLKKSCLLGTNAVDDSSTSSVNIESESLDASEYSGHSSKELSNGGYFESDSYESEKDSCKNENSTSISRKNCTGYDDTFHSTPSFQFDSRYDSSYNYVDALPNYNGYNLGGDSFYQSAYELNFLPIPQVPDSLYHPNYYWNLYHGTY